MVDPGEPQVDTGPGSVILEVDPVSPDDPQGAETVLTSGPVSSIRVYRVKSVSESLLLFIRTDT